MTTKIVDRANKTPISQHVRPTIDQVAIVIIGEEFDLRDIILLRRNGDVHRITETHRSFKGLQLSNCIFHRSKRISFQH